jgi:signal transduction histidine kinase
MTTHLPTILLVDDGSEISEHIYLTLSNQDTAVDITKTSVETESLSKDCQEVSADGVLVPTSLLLNDNVGLLTNFECVTVPIFGYTKEELSDKTVTQLFETGIKELLTITTETSSVLLEKRLQNYITWSQESRNSELLDRVTDAYFSLDENFNITDYNAEGFALINAATGDNLELGELLAENLWEIVPNIQNTVFAEAYKSALSESVEKELTEYYPPLDIWVEVTIYPSDSGLSIFVQDITQQKQLEIEREENVDVLFSLYDLASTRDLSQREQITEAIKLGRNLLDLSYGFVTRIENNEQKIQYTQNREDHPQLREGGVCPIDETYCQHILDKTEPLTVQNASKEGWAETPEYGRFELESYISQKLVVGGEVYGTLCFADDTEKYEEYTDLELAITELLAGWISHEIEREKTLTQLEAKNDRLEVFAEFISHDLRNPLSVAKGYLDMERSQHDSEHLKKVDNAHHRMDTMIDTFLDFARSPDKVQETEHISLKEVAERAWNTVDKQDSTLVVETDMEIDADKEKLMNVFENLFRNSIEHNNTPVTITVTENAKGTGFSVADDGKGIQETEIFDYGVSGSGSTGIGLSIVDAIVEAHGWRISCDSEYDDGACFIIHTE